MSRTDPSYLSLFEEGKLQERVEILLEKLKKCEICPRKCGVNRLEGEIGFCQTGRYAFVASYGPHYGEEAPLVGRRGSGTIFISSCNLKCVFCQNFDISHYITGFMATPKELAKIMLELQSIGCHNINIVTPTHVVPQIVEALPYAINMGLRIPLVYNTGGYDSVEIIKLLEGIFDIYMPDYKFTRKEFAQKYMNAPDYPQVIKEVLKEMHRQVGDLVIEDGIAVRGLLVRHLVMPNGIAGTEEVCEFIASEISKNTYLNIMDQYRPCGYASKYPEINRRITMEEFEKALRIAKDKGLNRLDKSEPRFIFWI